MFQGSEKVDADHGHQTWAFTILAVVMALVLYTQTFRSSDHLLTCPAWQVVHKLQLHLHANSGEPRYHADRSLPAWNAPGG